MEVELRFSRGGKAKDTREAMGLVFVDAGVKDWDRYYNRRSLMGLFEYDVPKDTKPEEFRVFVNFISEVAFELATPYCLSFLFAPAFCDDSYVKDIRCYSCKEGLRLDERKGTVTVACCSPATIENFILSQAAAHRRRAIGAFIPRAGAREICVSKVKEEEWFRTRFGELNCFLRFHLEKPSACMWFHFADREKISSAMAAVASKHGISVNSTRNRVVE